MSVCVYSVCAVLCVRVAALRRADPPSKESYRLCMRLRNLNTHNGGGVQLGPLGTSATDWPIVASPGWLWWWRILWNEDWEGKPKYSWHQHDVSYQTGSCSPCYLLSYICITEVHIAGESQLHSNRTFRIGHCCVKCVCTRSMAACERFSVLSVPCS
jgi:hypothetical protein